MLSPATRTVADRLIATLMTLVRAVAHIATAGSSPTLPAQAAETLTLRLANLITTLIRISTFGIRTPANRTTPAPIHPAPAPPPARPRPTQSRTPSLPRRPGWLLAALPDIAPAIAADLAALLADPAFAALLGDAPTLHRTLRPLLRGLDLAAAQPPPSPPTPPLGAPQPEPHHPPPPTRPRDPATATNPAASRRGAAIDHSTLRPSHVQIVT